MPYGDEPMDEDRKPVIDMFSESKRFAANIREIYDALVDENFTDEQAMTILILLLRSGFVQ